MSEITLASLAMAFDVASADPAIQKTDKLTASSRELENQARKTEAAVKSAAGAHGSTGTAAGKAEASMRSLAQVYGQARDSLGRFTDVDGSFRHSQEATALMVLRNAQAAAALGKQQEQAAKAVAKAEADAARSREADMNATATLLIRNAKLRDDLRLKEEQAAKATASYAAKFGALKAQLDPFAAVQQTLAQRTKLLDEAMAHGAITADQHAAALSQVTRAAASDVVALDRLQKAHGGAGEAARLQTYQLLNLGRQGADVFVSLASGQALWMVAVQQGAQIGEIFAEAKTQGVGFKAALAGVTAQIAPFLPLIAALGATAAALGLVAVGVKRNLDNQEAVRTFTGQLALNVDGLNYNAQALAATSKELAHFGLSAKDASAGLSTFVGAGVDASKLKDFSIAAKSLSEVSSAFKDVKSAQEAVSTAFTGGFDAVDKLDQKLNFLTVSQYEHIKAMFDAGQASDAQAEAFKAFSDQVDAAADKARGPWQESVRELSGAWNDFTDALARSDGVKTAVFGLEKLMGTVAAALRMAKNGAGTGSDAVPDFMRDRGVGYKIFNTLNPWAYLSDAAKRNEFNASAVSGVGALGKSQDGVRGADSQAAKAYSRVIDELNLQVDQAKKINDVERVRLAAEKKVAEAAEKGVSGRDPATGKDRLDIVREKAASIEQAKIDKERASAAKTSSAAANRAQRVDNRGDNAIEAAKSAELAAQTALTRNVEQIAVIKAAQIAQELKTQEVRLAGQVKAKEISQADADVAIGSYRVAAGYKAQALAIDTANQISQRDLQQRQEVLGYTQRVAQLQAAAAPTLEQANAIEAKALAERQAYDRDALQDAVAQRVVSGEITLTKGKLLLTEQKIAQAADAEDKARQDRLAIFQREQQFAQQGYQNEVDILSSRKGLAQSSYEAAQIERRVAAVRYAAERTNLQAILDNKDATAEQLDYAKARLPVIAEIYANEVRAAELSDNLVTAYADLGQAVAGAARAAIDGDIGGALSGASSALRNLSGLLGSDAGFGKLLGSAAAALGPAGAVVSAFTGVLGVIGEASAAKAQAKLDALNKSVEALRVDNKTSTGSIAGALDQANKNWNADLEYSSAMVTSLRSIDNQIGALANALSRQITAGGLLSTSTLGLGTTSQGPGTGTVLASGLIAKILPGLFGSKTNTELLDQGLAFNPTTYGQGVTGSTYADIVSTTTKKFLGVTTGVKVRNSTVNGAIDPSLLSQINGIIEALGNSVLSAASVFGAEAAKAAETALGSAVVDLGKLSLKDLKPDEIAAVLQATFDRVGDQLAAAGIPGLDKLATVGEGSFETLTRLAREYQVVDTSLAALGKTFGQVGLESLAARDNLVQLFGGLDAFTSATSFFATNFLTDAEQLAPVIKAVNDNLKAYGLSAESSRDAFKGLVLAQDLTTEAGRNTYAALLAVAPAFDKVASAAEKASSSRRELEIQLLDAMGKTDEAAKARLEIERQGVDESLRYLFDQIQAEKALTAAREAASVAAIADADAAAKMQDLWSKSTAAAIETATQAAERQAEASKTLSDGFAGLINKFHELSKSLNEFADSLGVGELSGLSGNDAYRATRSRLMGASGEQTQDAIRAFLAASREVSATDQAYQLDVAFAESVARQRALEASGSAVGIAELLSRAMASQAVGFATGGSFKVGGSGSADSQFFGMKLTPGEMVNVQRPGTANDNSEMAALRQEVRELRQVIASGLVKVADNVSETNEFLRNGIVTTVGA